MKRKLRILLGAIIVVATIAAFIWYVSNNPVVIDQLKQTSLATIILLIALFGGAMTVALGLVLYGYMLFYKKHMGWQENFVLNSYSSLLNFFGPGQSGPAFRGAYLKLKHKLQIRQYVFITLVYYAFYAFFSALLLAAASLVWWQAIFFLVLTVFICIAVIKLFLRRNKNLVNGSLRTRLKPLIIIGLATLLQVVMLWMIYFVELRAFDVDVSLGQAASYTGAANFALFVALTPGAIGFREAFLVFSQNLHHIPNEIIVAANILDRAVYMLFLGILFVAVLALHANKTLQVKKIRNTITDKDK